MGRARREAAPSSRISRALLGLEAVISDEDGRRAFETDALTAYRRMPLAVVLPRTTEEVSKVLKYCRDQNAIKGGAARRRHLAVRAARCPPRTAIVIGISRMNRVLEVDFDNRTITVETGITNLAITDAVGGRGLLLRARSVEPARLHDRRQHRHELGRRPLPQVRRHDQQRARRHAS